MLTFQQITSPHKNPNNNYALLIRPCYKNHNNSGRYQNKQAELAPERLQYSANKSMLFYQVIQSLNRNMSKNSD